MTQSRPEPAAPAPVRAMLVEQIDVIGPQTRQRGVGDVPDVLGAAVQPGRLGTAVRVESEPELDDLAKQVAQTMWGYPPTR